MLRRFRNSDAQLVRRTRTGHRNAFSTLVERYQQVVFASAYGIVANAADAEDVTQDAFLAAFMKLPSLREPAKFRSWILTIARNRATDLIAKRKRETPIDEAGLPGPDASDALADAELRALLRDRIERLPADHREILLLHYYAGLKVREIADQLSISTEAAKKRLQRARDLLSQRMLVHLRDTVEEQSPSSARTKAILALIAGASVTWNASAAAAATTGLLSAGAILKLAVAATVTAGAVGTAIWSIQAPSPPTRAAANASAPTAATPSKEAASPTASSEPILSPSTAQRDATSTETSHVNGGGVIQGRVVDATGTPQGGVFVTADAASDASPSHHQTTTDERGLFAFSALRNGRRHLLQAFAEGAFAADDLNAVNPADEKPGTEALVLRPAADLSGVVVDEAGKPVAGAAVAPQSVLLDGEPVPIHERWRRLRGIRTGENGRFTLSHAWLADWTVEVDSPAHVYWVGENLHPHHSPHRITLQEGARVSGRVVYTGTDDALPGLEIAIGNHRRARTDAEGYFHVTGVAPTAAQVSLPGDKNLIVTSAPFAVLPGRDVANVRVEVAPGGAISGCVRDADTGEPIRFATIQFGRVSSDLTRLANTGEEGCYEIAQLQPGKYRPV